MQRSWVALSAALVGSSAFAQTTTTNCQTYPWGNIQCTSTTPQSIPAPAPVIQPQSQGNADPYALILQYPNAGQAFSNAFQHGLEQQRMRDRSQQQPSSEQSSGSGQQAYATAPDGMPLVPPELRGTQMPPELISGPLHEAQAEEAGKMVAAGDCAGAETYALKQGNFALAQQVKDYCSK